MRPFTSTIPYHEALSIVLDAAVPIERVERVAIGEADGRVVARDVLSACDVPAFDRAAMDGYALRAADAAEASADRPATLVCVDRVLTGQVPRRSIGRGECIEVATGAPLPPGADAVVMVEDTTRHGDDVRLVVAVRTGQHIGPRAGDLATGQVVVTAGQVLNPSRVGALAATGVTAVDVYAQPTVALVSTGDEVVAPGEPLGPGRVYDVNRFTLAAVVRRHGGRPLALPTAADTMDALLTAFDHARGQDLIVSSGGSSVGERDLLRDVVARQGEIRFHGVAVKPGKPTVFGTIGGRPVFGLSGYPTSCLCNAYTLVVPFLRKVARLPPWRPRTLDMPLARGVASAAGRHQFYTVRIAGGQAEPAFKASGDITSMAHADGYIEIPAETEAVAAGTVVRVNLF